MSTAILIPLMRPDRIGPLIDNIVEATEPGTFHVYVLATGECAEAAFTASKRHDLLVTVHDDGGGSWPARMNTGYHLTSEPFLFTGQDDIRFHSGWLSRAVEAMGRIPDGGVVQVNDLFNAHGTMALVSRQYLDTMGGCVDTPGTMIHPGYVHNFSDNEFFETAQVRARMTVCVDSVVEHLHPLAGKGLMDAVYYRGNSYFSQDERLFGRRRPLWAGSVPKVTTTERWWNRNGVLVYPPGRLVHPVDLANLISDTERKAMPPVPKPVSRRPEPQPPRSGVLRWQILIASVQPRTPQLRGLLDVLSPQLIAGEVEVLICRDKFRHKIGRKRNFLVERSTAEYVNFVDDDDMVAPDYVATLYPLLDGVDTVTFDLDVKGGGFPRGYRVSHSLNHQVGWFDDHRNVDFGHLCPMRRELHMLGCYSDGFGDDTAWGIGVRATRRVAREYHIDRCLYEYRVSDGAIWRGAYGSGGPGSVSRHPPYPNVTYVDIP